LKKFVTVLTVLVLSAALWPALVLAQSTVGSSPNLDVPIGSVTEDGSVRTGQDTFIACGSEIAVVEDPAAVERNSAACRQAGFPPLDYSGARYVGGSALDDEAASSNTDSTGSPTGGDPAEGSNHGPVGGYGSVPVAEVASDATLPDTGGAPLLLLVTGLLLAGAGLVACYRSRAR
jgi:hypothetical protein